MKKCTARFLALLRSDYYTVFPTRVFVAGAEQINPCSVFNEQGGLVSVRGRCFGHYRQERKEFFARHDWGCPRIQNPATMMQTEIGNVARYYESLKRAERCLQEDLQNQAHAWMRRQQRGVEQVI